MRGFSPKWWICTVAQSSVPGYKVASRSVALGQIPSTEIAGQLAHFTVVDDYCKVALEGTVFIFIFFDSVNLFAL